MNALGFFTVNHIGTASAAFAALTALAVPAHGDVILSNLSGLAGPSVPQLGTSIGPTMAPSAAADFTKAVGITTGASAFRFDAMHVLVTSSPARLSGGIYSDLGGNPGALLASFATLTLGQILEPTLVVLTTTTDFTLDPATTYWFRLTSPTGDSDLNWNRLDPNVSPSPAGGVGFAGYRFSTDGGASWSVSTTPNVVAIEATAIPAPGTAALLGLGGLLGSLRRRRARA
ncbi:MAG: PEP-CTERM sorting domain-containing protein [Phycisphaerales bacterium]|nr:PEP-CTERM sorting domain-containing protein [Phycisphaerales bacterium]